MFLVVGEVAESVSRRKLLVCLLRPNMAVVVAVSMDSLGLLAGDAIRNVVWTIGDDRRVPDIFGSSNECDMCYKETLLLDKALL